MVGDVVCRHEAQVVLVVLWVYDLQVLRQQVVCEARELEKLSEVPCVIDTWEDLFKVAQSVLLLLEIQDDLDVIICQFFVHFPLQLLDDACEG